jgi:hypothetical protein
MVIPLKLNNGFKQTASYNLINNGTIAAQFLFWLVGQIWVQLSGEQLPEPICSFHPKPTKISLGSQIFEEKRCSLKKNKILTIMG